MIRYLIFGAGAVGTLLGGLLAKAGHTVVFIGRTWNIDGIRQHGITITGVWGDYSVGPQQAYTQVDEIPDQEREFDQIFITTKAFATRNAIQQCLRVVQDATLVISCQNGYGNCQTIAEHVGWHRTLGARIITGVELPCPGDVHVTVHADSVRLGHYLREYPIKHLESIALTMREAGIPTEATEQLEQYIWAKILYNAALNPLGAMLGVTYGELAEHEPTRKIMNSIIDEAFKVTSAHTIRQFWESPEEYLDRFYHQMVPPTKSHYPSMLRDIEKKRRTEIDSINGAICQLGKEAQVLTPVNDTLVSLMHFREKMNQLNHAK